MNFEIFKTLSREKQASMILAKTVSLRATQKRFLARKLTFGQIQEYKQSLSDLKEMKAIHFEGASLFGYETEEEPF